MQEILGWGEFVKYLALEEFIEPNVFAVSFFSQVKHCRRPQRQHRALYEEQGRASLEYQEMRETEGCKKNIEFNRENSTFKSM